MVLPLLIIAAVVGIILMILFGILAIAVVINFFQQNWLIIAGITLAVWYFFFNKKKGSY